MHYVCVCPCVSVVACFVCLGVCVHCVCACTVCVCVWLLVDLLAKHATSRLCSAPRQSNTLLSCPGRPTEVDHTRRDKHRHTYMHTHTHTPTCTRPHTHTHTYTRTHTWCTQPPSGEPGPPQYSESEHQSHGREARPACPNVTFDPD